MTQGVRKDQVRVLAEQKLKGRTGRAFWQALDELTLEPVYRRAVRAEFASAFDGLSETDRRGLLRAMGASLALAGLAGCTGAGDPHARPYVNAPDDTILGQPKYYATAVIFGGYAQPVLGTTHEGRPTKLEGLPEHPAARGATDAFTQAALLDLYDPGRSKSPRQNGQPVGWDAFDAAMVANAARLDAAAGEGFRLLTGATSSPTFARQWAALQARWPKARWHVLEPVNDDVRREAARLAFGRPLEVLPRLDRCQVMVSFDDDLLGPGPRQTFNARNWSMARKAYQHGQQECRLLVAEPAPSLTGAVAQDRLIASAHEIEGLVAMLASRLGVGTAPQMTLTPRQTQWLDEAASHLSAVKQAGLVTVGAAYPAAIQALAFAINDRLGSLGKAATLSEPILLAPPDGAQSFANLCQDMAAGLVDTLVMIDVNPAYAAPKDADFRSLLKRVRLSVHAGLHYDETGALCPWHAPTAHALESWSDARAVDGRPTILQPLVQPFDGGRPAAAILENLQGRLNADARTLVMDTWRPSLSGDFDSAWSAALVRGFVDQSAQEVTSRANGLAAPAHTAPPQGLTLLFRPDPTIWDGARANNPWLQEAPKPFNKVVWDNIVAIAPALAREQKLANGDHVRLEADGRRIEGPVWIMPGQERRTVVAHLGYGRRVEGQVADGLGYDAYALRTQASPWRLDNVTLTPTGRRRSLASTQVDTALGDADLIHVTPRAKVAPGPKPAPHGASLYPTIPTQGPQWGMSIDTDLCIGCNACVTACDAENNVAMVGQEQALKGRAMHWLRVDQYYEGSPDEPALFNQPVPCMHCEQAPCEMGCPVNAAVHTHDGLNMQVYNRCIGTRTCSSFCPYKVRRFNWFNYTAHDSPELQAARNPEVTVRSRGVMEKCNYCVQRIEKARIQAKVEGRPIADGEIRTACQQACPTDAIVFGNVADSNSAVSRLKAQQRDYTLLPEANTRPRTTYLARLSDDEGGRGQS